MKRTVVISRLGSWLEENHIARVEAMTPDVAGLPRGKILPVNAFLEAVASDSLRFPSSLYCITVDGGFVDYKDFGEIEEDLLLIPDVNTLCVAPELETPTASVICDAVYHNGDPAAFTPRQVLRDLVSKFTQRGWYPIVAPELEFFLLPVDNSSQGMPAVMPTQADRGPFGIESVVDHGGFFDDLLQHCEAHSIGVKTLIREAGKGQFELSVNHTDPLTAADHTFHFRSAARRIARRHGLAVSFMARPYPTDFGSAMHIHQSLEDAAGNNLFADEQGNDSPLFLAYIAGLQHYSAAAMALLAPYGNSYLRIGSDLSAPANTHWGVENRSVGFRVPESGPAARRVENRIPGADVNPYLAFAATLACGYLGIVEKRLPSKPLTSSAYNRRSRRLPGHLVIALDTLHRCKPLRELFGDVFVDIFLAIKQAEYTAQTRALSAWELEHLINNV
jgi:glutamine synthetase